MTNRNQPDVDDPRVFLASQQYLAELEAGRQPDRRLYYQRYPELETALLEVFDGIELAQILQPRPNVPTELMAEPLGDFRILREIGRGGMGIVYEAVQLSLGRRVALKVLPFSASLDARQRQRFQLEAQAAALLHHTNIVPVYAVGCERGLHFYAMQLIEGGSLADFIIERKNANDTHHVDSPLASTLQGALLSTRPSLTPYKSNEVSTPLRALVALIAQVADALAYAHQEGTIHRDIKPANLLLDHRGDIWITDFGLAHVTADVSLTVTGDLLGTMRYMSPEQAGGERAVLDGRTDIYSLGATLYELLVLKPVFRSTARQTLLNDILNNDPIPPRNWDRAIPVELETIVLKCLAKSPADRYATAAELAADLRRFLDDRPILAQRPTVIDRCRKWLRRHPSFLAAGALVLVSGVIGLGLTTWVVSRSLERERQRSLEAEARFQLARRAADDMIRIAQNELSNAPFQDGPRKSLLEEALQYYQELIDLRKGDPEDQADLAETRDQVSTILADLTALEAGRHNILLREQAVLDDLQATIEQRQLLAALSDQTERKLQVLGEPDRPATESQAEILKFARANNAAFSAVLTSEQSARLKQIALQWGGPRVFLESDVAAELELTSEQRDRIRRIERQMLFGHHATGSEPHRPGPPDQELLQEVTQEILSVLSPEQQSRWQRLIGRPYEGPVGVPFRGGAPPFLFR